MRTLHTNQLNDYKRLIEQLELEKEQFRRSELIQIEQAKNAAVATFNNEEREKIEQLNQENQQYKNKLDELQVDYFRTKKFFKIIVLFFLRLNINLVRMNYEKKLNN